MVLGAVKDKLLPGKKLDEKEMETFTDLVFEDWLAGDDHDMPNDNACVAGIKDVGFKLGILLEAAGASPAESGKKRPRARANHKLYSNKVGISKYAHRQEHQPVWFMVEKSKGKQLSISLRDAKAWKLAMGCKVQVTEAEDIDDAAFWAIKNHDKFVSKCLHAWNLQVVVFVARNRVTNWANGATSTKVPDGENYPDVLTDLLLCRHVDTVSGVSAAALKKLKETPEPKLIVPI